VLVRPADAIRTHPTREIHRELQMQATHTLNLEYSYESSYSTVTHWYLLVAELRCSDYIDRRFEATISILY
jgi:hypothetical protein